MSTGENEQGLRKIIDMTRLISIVILVLHCYYYCFAAFERTGWASAFTSRLLLNVTKTGLFNSFNTSKWITLAFLVISLIGPRGKKSETINKRIIIVYLVIGITCYFSGQLLFYLRIDVTVLATAYIFTTGIGYLLLLSGGTMVSRIIQLKLNDNDIFNRDNESFPQEERLLTNEYSINLPATYYYKGQTRKSWINIINPFRSLLVLGTPGSGKSFFVINNVIRQHIEKGFAMFIYDFKFDDLSLIAYNHYLQNKNAYTVEPKFFVINFEDLSRTHRCNPLDKENMLDITDAAEAARTILMGLNREWIKKQGDFFVESPINFLTAIIWFLRKYNDGAFCTLPHVIELMQIDYEKLFTVLRTEKEIEALINPFISAYENDVMEQLEGQIASAKISMARLVSPQLYYVLSGNDFTLDINEPTAPKIVCMGNNPQKVQVYGAVLSLYVSRLIKTVNRKGKQKCSLVFDEFPTIYLNNMDGLIATARSNRVATTLGVQDFSQLKKDYGKDQADVIMNITGNIISGQVSGETAKQLSDRFGKILQDRTSMSINRNDTSISKSKQLDSAVPVSKIATLSSGEFVGIVADDPTQRVPQKAFYSEIDRPDDPFAGQQQEIPFLRNITGKCIEETFQLVGTNIGKMIDDELQRIFADPSLIFAIVRKR